MFFIAYTMKSKEKEEFKIKNFLLTLVTIIIFSLSCPILTYATETAHPDTDSYKDIMIECVTTGDTIRGHKAEVLRGFKTVCDGLNYKYISFNDLNLLSKIMSIEAGNCEEKYYWGVGEVVLNRVASPEFPNTIQEVLDQEGPQQYYGKDSKLLASRIPEKHVVEAAWRLLEGERHLLPTVVFHNSVPDGKVFAQFNHKLYGPFYLCMSNYPELYK